MGKLTAYRQRAEPLVRLSPKILMNQLKACAVIGGVLLHLMACSAESLGPSLGQSVLLAYEASVHFPDENLRVTFTEVVEDSRCPLDVVCVQAGRVVVTLRLVQGGQALGVAKLGLGEPGIPSTRQLAGYSISLLDVSPHPTSVNAPISASAYRVQVRVET